VVRAGGELRRPAPRPASHVAKAPRAPPPPQSTARPPGPVGTWPPPLHVAAGGGAADSVHVCFCTDDRDLRPLAVAINSTLANARNPGRVVFHIITTAEAAQPFASAIKSALPTAQVRLHYSDAIEAHIKGLVTFRRSSGARKGLASPFNFAPFYLDAFLASQISEEERRTGLPSRLIYLDTDVVLSGDITQLQELNLEGSAVAAVEDCLQTFEIYIDFKQLRKLVALPGIDPKACVFNRGVFVMDVQRWRDLNLTQEIESWMERYRHSKKDIYKFGMSQPPWLLAVRGRYRRLGGEWNCRGLGREFLNAKEYADLKAQGFDGKSLKGIGMKPAGPHQRPYVATCAAGAQLLHFNGGMKPWRRAKWDKRQLRPLCTVPKRSREAHAGKTLRAKDTNFTECAGLWWAYLSPAAAPALDLRDPPAGTPAPGPPRPLP